MTAIQGLFVHCNVIDQEVVAVRLHLCQLLGVGHRQPGLLLAAVGAILPAELVVMLVCDHNLCLERHGSVVLFLRLAPLFSGYTQRVNAVGQVRRDAYGRGRGSFVTVDRTVAKDIPLRVEQRRRYGIVALANGGMVDRKRAAIGAELGRLCRVLYCKRRPFLERRRPVAQDELPLVSTVVGGNAIVRMGGVIRRNGIDDLRAVQIHRRSGVEFAVYVSVDLLGQEREVFAHTEDAIDPSVLVDHLLADILLPIGGPALQAGAGHGHGDKAVIGRLVVHRVLAADQRAKDIIQLTVRDGQAVARVFILRSGEEEDLFVTQGAVRDDLQAVVVVDRIEPLVRGMVVPVGLAGCQHERLLVVGEPVSLGGKGLAPFTGVAILILPVVVLDCLDILHIRRVAVINAEILLRQQEHAATAAAGASVENTPRVRLAVLVVLVLVIGAEVERVVGLRLHVEADGIPARAGQNALAALRSLCRSRCGLHGGSLLRQSGLRLRLRSRHDRRRNQRQANRQHQQPT